ncbi:hypothetical protein RBH26_08730 [Natronolimnohabitans sp. A-GB9]|uniref:hypothetical protein n=1 Tax=Natronolimnohabitans sp. A-GB9 TaxID=3069757 RepID=UPI0027B6C29B|nr:hypothetical protein [Natronolimnohabitans sp. A-GB9]MDQ2050571.1 hypothetical protein [Natronolimnohabitans sp. A-GB9]
MSTQPLQTRSESQPNYPSTRTRTTAERTTTRSAVERCPQTFSHQETAQLQNLIDEFNAAFATADSAGGA